MRQLLLLILLFVVGQWFVKTLRRAQSAARPGEGDAGGGAGTAGGTARTRSAGRGAAAPASLPEPMVRCAECGVHAPKSESLVVAGQPFCSDEHARRYAARMAGSDTAGSDTATR